MKVSVGRFIIVLGANIVLMYSPNCIIQQAAESMRGGGLDIIKSATISKIVFLIYLCYCRDYTFRKKAAVLFSFGV